MAEGERGTKEKQTLAKLKTVVYAMTKRKKKFLNLIFRKHPVDYNRMLKALVSSNVCRY